MQTLSKRRHEHDNNNYSRSKYLLFIGIFHFLFIRIPTIVYNCSELFDVCVCLCCVRHTSANKYSGLSFHSGASFIILNFRLIFKTLIRTFVFVNECDECGGMMDEMGSSYGNSFNASAEYSYRILVAYVLLLFYRPSTVHKVPVNYSVSRVYNWMYKR